MGERVGRVGRVCRCWAAGVLTEWDGSDGTSSRRREVTACSDRRAELPSPLISPAPALTKHQLRGGHVGHARGVERPEELAWSKGRGTEAGGEEGGAGEAVRACERQAPAASAKLGACCRTGCGPHGSAGRQAPRECAALLQDKTAAAPARERGAPRRTCVGEAVEERRGLGLALFGASIRLQLGLEVAAACVGDTAHV